MNSNIINSLRQIEIPNPADTLGKALTLQNLMGQNQLQQAQIRAAGQPKQLDPKDQMDIMSKTAGALASASQQDRAAIYQNVVLPTWERYNLPGKRPLPAQWSDEYLPHFQGLASMGLSADQAISRGEIANAPDFPGSTVSGLLNQGQGAQQPAYPGVQYGDGDSGATVRSLQPGKIEVTEVDEPAIPGPGWQPGGPTQPPNTGQAAGEMTGPQTDVIGNPAVSEKVQMAQQHRAYAQQLRNTRQSANLAQAKVHDDEAARLETEANNLQGRRQEDRRISSAEEARARSEALERERLADSRLTREETRKDRELAQKSKGIENTNKLRDDFVKASKVFVDTRDAYSRIQDSAKDPSAAGDLAMIFNYMKLLDPGSVVREGEFATAQSAAGVPDRVRNYYNRILSGERLNENQRADFVDRADRLYKGQLKNQEALETQYKDISKRSGVDSQDVVINYRALSGGAPANQGRRATDAKPTAKDFSGGQMTATNPQTGEKIMSDDGGKTWRKAK